MADKPKSESKSIMRSLGEFVGHVWWGIKTDPAKSKKVVETQQREERRGRVTLRETTIREIEFDADAENDDSPPPT